MSTLAEPIDTTAGPQSEPAPTPRRARKSTFRWKPWLIGVLSLVLLGSLAALGVTRGVPWALRGPVAQWLSEQLGRPLTIADAQLHLSKLSLTIQGLQLHETSPSAPPTLSIKELSVDLSSRSMLSLAPIVERITVTEPQLRLTRNAQGHFNIADLIQRFTGSPSKPDPSAPPARFSLKNLHLHSGSVVLEDQVQGTRHAFEQIDFSLPSIDSFIEHRNQFVSPTLTARLHGGEIHLSAKTKPFSDTPDTSLQLDLKELDIASILENLPGLKPWTLDSGRVSANWTVGLQSSPAKPSPEGSAASPKNKQLAISAQGRIGLSDLSLRGPAQEHLSLSGIDLDQIDLKLEFPNGVIQWVASANALSLSDLRLLKTKEGSGPLVLDRLALSRLAAESQSQRVSLGQVDLNGMKLRVERNSKGILDLQTLLANLPGQASSSEKQTTSTDSLPTQAPPWRVDLEQVNLAGIQATWRDETLSPALEVSLQNLQGQLSPVSSQPDQSINYQLSTSLGTGGQIALKGQAHPGKKSLDTQMQLSAIQLAWLQPYLPPSIRLEFSKGHLDINGRLNFDLGDTPSSQRIRFKGSAEIGDFYAREPGSLEDFIRWHRLGAKQLDIDIHPQVPSAKDHLRLGAVELEDLFAKVVIHPSGRINLQEILPSDPAEQSKGSVDTSAKTTPDATAPAATTTTPGSKPDSKPTPGPAVEIGAIKVSGGRLAFTDNFIKPNYSTTITDLQASVSALASQRDAATIRLQGRIEGDAPLTAEGQVNPFGKALFLNLTAKARGIDLPMFTPYSTKYAGYPITKGKLSVELSYTIDQGSLNAQNTVFLDQLTFGERVDSSSATQLPVLFAVALMKNSRGEININLPISGSLNDPQFSVGSIVVQVLLNILKKAVTSPFNLLASMLGSDKEDLSLAEFNPGTSELLPDTQARLDKLAQALESRPELKLDMTIHVDPAAELGDLRKNRLMERLVAERRRKSPASDSFDPNPRRWPEQDYAQWLQRLYEITPIANKPRTAIGLAKKLHVGDMETLLLASIAITDAEWRDLAQQRAQIVRSLLTPRIASERVFTLAPVIEPSQAPAERPAAGGSSSCSVCAVFTLR